MYAKANQLGTATYEQHVLEYLDKVGTKSISFDFYGLKKEHEVKYDYFKNLDIIRSLTLNIKKPFWVITQAGPIGTDTLDPTEQEQRWTVWSNIAMGSKGIAYFTYWTPGPEANLGPVGFMVLRDGTKRDIYYWIKKINSDIKTIGQKLIHCHSDGVIMSKVTYPLWDNNGNGRTKYGPILELKQNSQSQSSVMCGCFRDARTSANGDNYKGYKAMVMAKIQNFDVVADLTLDPSVTTVTFTHNNTSSTIDLVSGLHASVGDVSISYINGILTLDIPSGEAVLIEF